VINTLKYKKWERNAGERKEKIKVERNKVKDERE
jgi:hypothetical protein